MRDHGRPILGYRLPVQPRGRIPRAVGAPQLPAPIGVPGQQNPGRTSEGAGQMRHAGIDADDQIQAIAERGGVAEIVELSGGIEHLGMRLQQPRLCLVPVPLQTDVLEPGGQMRQ